MKLLIQWAVTSGVLILIVLAARCFFRLSARLKYALWAVVLVRLLVPFQVALPASVSPPLLASNLAPHTPAVLTRPLVPETADSSRTFTAEEAEHVLFDPHVYTVTDSEDGSIRAYTGGFTLEDAVVVLWLAGAVLAGLVILGSNLRFYFGLRRRRKLMENADAPVPVYVAESLPSPCLFGVLRPAVYVTPEAADDPAALRHVLAHELTHYAHRDHIWSVLRCLALALHWYDPLVWLAAALSKGDGELACDEGAVARLGEEERIPYGRTLVDMVARRSARPADLLSCSTAMTGGRKSIQQRVARLVKKPETVKAAVFAAVTVMALAAVFVFAERGPSRTRNDMLQDYLDRTTSITYAPPIYSSVFYPYPISDADLLAQAKEALSGFTYLEGDDPRPDLSPEEVLHESRITLTFDGEMSYSLLWQNDRTYLFIGSVWQDVMDLKEEKGENAQLLGSSGDCVSKEGHNVIAILEGLAREQKSRVQADAAVVKGNPTFAEFSAQVEAAKYIHIGNPMISSAAIPGAITDPELLAQAKELLSEAREVRSISLEDIPWESLRESLSDTRYHDMDRPPEGALDRQEELEQGLFQRGHPLTLCSTPEYREDAASRYWLIPWETGPCCYLVRWDAEREEEPIDLLAIFYADDDSIISRLQALVRQTEEGPSFEQYLSAVESAAAIYYDDPSPYHAGEIHPPIVDGDLLPNAKARLSSFTPMDQLGPGPQPDLGEARYARQVTLCPTRDKAGGQTYALFLYDGYTYLLTAEGHTPLARSAEPEDVSDFILSLSRIEYNRALDAERGDLTQEQIDRANEAFPTDQKLSDGSYGPTEISCFFTSSYTDPTQIDLPEFLRYCPIAIDKSLENDEAEEFRAVMKAAGEDYEEFYQTPFDFPTPVHRYPRAEVSALLQKYAGVTVEELDWQPDRLIYLEKYDAFYNFTSDYGPGFFQCIGGEIAGDTVRLWSDYRENGDRSELTLRRENGTWLIQSFHTAYPR